MELAQKAPAARPAEAPRRQSSRPQILAWTVFLVVLGSLIWSARADAAPFGQAEEAAWAEAQAYWQMTPTLCTSISEEVVPAGSLDGPEVGVLGRATQPEAPTTCSIRIVEGMSGVDLCAVMTHEYGHLLGYSHADPEMAVLYTCTPPAAAAVAVAPEQSLRWAKWHRRQATCKGSRSVEHRKCMPRLRRQAKQLRAAL